MYCPNPECHNVEHRVLESSHFLDKYVTRRRRECLNCSTRFTSYEITHHDLINKKTMNDLFKKLSIEIKINCFNQIEKIKEDLEKASMRLEQVKYYFSAK